MCDLLVYRRLQNWLIGDPNIEIGTIFRVLSGAKETDLGPISGQNIACTQLLGFTRPKAIESNSVSLFKVTIQNKIEWKTSWLVIFYPDAGERGTVMW
jgi:hypothetical protein